MTNFKFTTLFVIALATLNLGDAAPKMKLGDVPEKNADSQKQDPITDVLKEKDPAPEFQTGSIEENYQLIRDVTEEFYQKGLKAYNNGDLGTAEAYFDRVLTIKPSHIGAKKGIDAIMKSYEESTPSNTVVDPKIQLMNKLEDKLYERLTDEEYEEAAGVANEILAIDPNHKLAKQKLTYVNRKLYAEALERGRVREEAGDERGAIDAYQLAMGYGKDASLKEKISSLRQKLTEKNKNRSSELYIQALAASQNGNMEEAITLSKKALQLDPKNIQAQRMYDRLSAQTPQPN